jgi:hypothetical protein
MNVGRNASIYYVLPEVTDNPQNSRSATRSVWPTMMSKEDAINMRNYALTAIEQLSELLNIAWERCSPEEYEQIKKGVGLSMGRIQILVLDVLYESYPEIDHLK